MQAKSLDSDFGRPNGSFRRMVVSKSLSSDFAGDIMIIGIEAPMSAGKTLVMTYFLMREFLELDKPLLTNYELLKLPHDRISTALLTYYVQNKIALKRVAIGIDEAHLWFDSRLSMSARNRTLSYFVTQTSKNDINLYYTTQDLGMVDRRLRKQTAIGVAVEELAGSIFRVCGVNRYTGEKVLDVKLDGRPIFSHFNTHEVVSMDDHGEAVNKPALQQDIFGDR